MDRRLILHTQLLTISRIPDNLIEDIDFDNDAIKDMRIEYHSGNNEARVVPMNPRVIALQDAFKRKNGFTLRIAINR